MEGLLLFLVGAVLVSLFWLARRRLLSFHGQSPQDYEHLGPDFDLKRQLDGPILCQGVIFGPTGRVTSRFVADMHGEWDGPTGVLREAFRYDSGATQDRAWRLDIGEGGLFTAEADDVIGRGEGRHRGPTVQLKYRLRLPEDAGGYVLDVTDWMYLVEDGVIINRSQFRKFGIMVAELVATMQRKDTVNEGMAG